MYQVLARKYRPKNFHELLGQNHVSTALINGIEQQRLHHAYLFTGTRGVGKTTIARILSKCLNCETGVTSEPCGVCSTCVAIDAGRFIDLIEIDAASRTKVEDTRELLDNVPYAPTQGRYKVYLIDEVHMLSTHSFNALLKTLEEPPEHVKFLLATTDPQKLPITIISRCLQFVLRPIPQVQLADYLAVILQKESITFSPDALWQLASSARGSVRDALSLTDQAIAFGNGQIEPATVKSMLGLIDQADVVGLITAIVQQQKSEVAHAITQLREQVVDAKAVFDSLGEILHQVTLLQVLPDFDLQLNSEQTQARKQLAKIIPADLLQLYYEIVVQSRENIGLANTPLQALEMCILRLLAFRPLANNEVAVHERIVNETTSNLTPTLPSNSPQIEQTIHDESVNSESLADEINIEKKTADNGLNELPNQITQSEEILEIDESFSQNFSTENHAQNANPQSKLHEIHQDIQESEQGSRADNFQLALDNSQADFAEIFSANDMFHSPEFDNQKTENTNSPAENQTQLNTENFSHESPVLNVVENSYHLENYPQDIAYQNTSSQNNVPQNNVLQDNFAQNPISENNLSQDGAVVENSQLSKQEHFSSENLANSDTADISPLALLEPAPQELVGEWSPQKWDYWVYQARKQNWLAEDELVLAKRGLMTGVIAGKSQFLTHKNILTDTRTFDDLCQKLAVHFPTMQVSLATTQSNNEVNLTDIPENQQTVRETQALAVAKEQIQQLPVIQALLAQNASVQNVVLKK